MEEALVKGAGLTFEAIAATGLRGKNPFAAAGGLWTLTQGYRQSRGIIRQFQPDALLATGGYVCVPVALAARQAGVPVIIYLPDAQPGLAIRFLAHFARRVAVTLPESLRYFKPGQAVVTGYPVRPELFAQAEAGKSAARRQLGLSDAWPTLLVFGGSRGARNINRAVTGQLEAYLAVSQIIHVTGALDEAWVRERRAQLPPDLQARYRVESYLHAEMPAALVAADLVVSRAGASVIGEFPAAGLPAVLVPLPLAGAHQALNAAYLARHQAAVVVNDADLKQDLQESVLNLITNQTTLDAMAAASRSLSKPDAAARLAQEILEVRNNGG